MQTDVLSRTKDEIYNSLNTELDLRLRGLIMKHNMCELIWQNMIQHINCWC